MPDSPAAWLLLVAAAHAGFQLTVDLVVYPALSDVPADGWTAAHSAHSHRITPLVVLLYPALVLAAAWTLATRPADPGAWVAAVGAAVAVCATAASAAPAHRRLSSSRVDERPALLRTLLLADRIRTVGALVCLAGAVLAVG